MEILNKLGYRLRWEYNGCCLRWFSVVLKEVDLLPENAEIRRHELRLKWLLKSRTLSNKRKVHLLVEDGHTPDETCCRQTTTSDNQFFHI